MALPRRILLLLAAALMMAAMTVIMAVPAFAQGDPQGKFEQGTDQANSICSFSGLNDNPDEAFPENGQVQSYGQLVKKGQKSSEPSPGEFCNGHTHPYPEAFQGPV